MCIRDRFLALLVRHLLDINIRLAERADLVLLDGLAVEARKRVVEGFLQDRTAANALVDDAGRDLACAESGNIDLRADRLVGRVEARLEPVSYTHLTLP